MESEGNSTNLKREILKSALIGQKQSESTLVELKQQGEKLRKSLGEGKSIVFNDTRQTKEAVDALVNESKLAKRNKLVQFCHYCWLCCCCCKCKRANTQLDNSAKNIETQQNRLVQELPIDAKSHERDDYETASIGTHTSRDQAEEAASEKGGKFVDRVRRLLKETNVGQAWKQTVGPSIDVLRKSKNVDLLTNSNWFRQIDSSLYQLQRINEEIGQNLEEQIASAQMLTVYLNYGVDQVIGIKEKLNTTNKLID